MNKLTGLINSKWNCKQIQLLSEEFFANNWDKQGDYFPVDDFMLDEVYMVTWLIF